MENLFCNKCNLSEKIPQLIAEEVLGAENLSLLKERYQQMKEGYNFSYEQWQGLFTENLKPFRGYADTTGIMMSVKHPKFKTDFEQLGEQLGTRPICPSSVPDCPRCVPNCPRCVPNCP